MVLVHIPNDCYPFFVQPILRILFGESYGSDSHSTAWTDRHDFLNLSITPIGCSLICSTALADKHLRSLANQFNNLLTNTKSKTKPATIEISHDEYTAIQVEGQGLDAGQRVLDLTGPLAMAGISIFFVTSYFCDYILVPTKSRHIVTTTLQQRGFVFSKEADAYVSQLSPTLQHSPVHERPQTASSSGSEGRSWSQSVPTTPPAKDIPELQIRTFTKLMKNGIEPIVKPKLRLVSCAAGRDFCAKDRDKLKNDLMQVLLATNAHSATNGARPESRQDTGLGIQHLDPDDAQDFSAIFLSVTLSEEPISIFMEERLLPRLASTLLCSKGAEDILVPIILDLRSLGWTATGIVGGVAGRLSQGPVSITGRLELEGSVSPQGIGRDEEPVEISFLSSAKAGSVIVRADQLNQAVRALQMGMEEVQGRK